MKKTFLSRRSAADIGRAMGGHSNNYRGETEKRKLVHERRSSLLPPLKNIRHREGERGRSVTVVQGSLQWQRPLYGLPLPTLCNVTSLLLEYALRVPLRGRGLLSLTTRYEDIVLDNGYFGPRPYITCCPRWGSHHHAYRPTTALFIPVKRENLSLCRTLGHGERVSSPVGENRDAIGEGHVSNPLDRCEVGRNEMEREEEGEKKEKRKRKRKDERIIKVGREGKLALSREMINRKARIRPD